MMKFRKGGKSLEKHLKYAQQIEVATKSNEGKKSIKGTYFSSDA